WQIKSMLANRRVLLKANRRKTKKRALLNSLSLYLLLTSCQFAPKRYSDLQQGQWAGKILIRDKQNHKSHLVHININAQGRSALRMDVTAPIGGHLASLVVKDSTVQYLLLKEKKFFEGPTNPRILRPLFSLPLDPRHLFNIVFEEPIKQRGWNCELSTSGKPTSCKNAQYQIDLEWKEHRG